MNDRQRLKQSESEIPMKPEDMTDEQLDRFIAEKVVAKAIVA